MRRWTNKIVKEKGWKTYTMINPEHDAVAILGYIEDQLEREGFTTVDIVNLAYQARKNLDEEEKRLTEQQKLLLDLEEENDISPYDLFKALRDGIWVAQKGYYKGQWRKYCVEPNEMFVDMDSQAFIVMDRHEQDWGDDYYMVDEEISFNKLGTKWFLTKEEAEKYVEEINKKEKNQ